MLDADERPGAPPVVVLGYDVWRQWFGGRADAIGHTAQLGRTVATVVGIMPEGFAFPLNHQLWMPLQLRGSGYAPLEGSAVQVFGRLAPGATRAKANVELTALAERTAAASPRTDQHLRPRVLAYGAEYPDDQSWIAFSMAHLPIILVLIVACANVGTLVYARTATRDAEIATRYALGASRGRIIGQLFIEALVLASVAAIVGLGAAHWTLKWGFEVYMAGDYVPPFWFDPGLKLTTVLYAAVAPAVRSAEVETAAGATPIRVANLWTSSVGPGYFEAFDRSIVSGRSFHDGDRAEGARTVLVNEAFARRYTHGASPIGRRVRYAAADPAKPEPWFEIVGMVQDVGMTPTDRGEAAYVYRAVSSPTASRLVMGVRMAGDPESLAPRLRILAASLDPGLRLDEVRTLEEFV